MFKKFPAALIVATVLSACSGFNSALAPNGDNGLMLKVPFFPDKAEQCGPAALASVLAYWARPADLRTLKEEIFVGRPKGTLPMDMLLAAESHGLRARIYSGQLDTLKAEVKDGHPLVVLLKDRYAVVTGYDDRRGGVFIHSGSSQNKFMSFNSFMSAWDKKDRWTLLALPQEEEVLKPRLKEL